MDNLCMGETDHPTEGFTQAPSDLGPLAAGAALPSALCPGGTSMCGCQAAQRAPLGSRESGPAHQPASVSLPWQKVQRAGLLRASWLPPTCKPSKSDPSSYFPFSVAAHSPMQLLVEANAAGTNKQPLHPVLDMLLPKFSSKE